MSSEPTSPQVQFRGTAYGTFNAYWSTAPLDELSVTQGIQTGPFGSQLHQEDYVSSGGTPIITVEHLTEGRIEGSSAPLVSAEDAERLSKFRLQTGDIVFSRVGAVDRCGLVTRAEDGWLFSGRCIRIRPDQKLIEPSFLRYFFMHRGVRDHLRRIAVGATMPSLNTGLLSGIEVGFPPLPEQRAIASVLGALDDKIESNLQLIRLLTWTAETYFTKVTKSAATTVALGEVGNIIGGGTPKSSEPTYWSPDEVPWVTPKDMTALAGVPVVWNGARSISQLGLDESSAKMLPAGTVLYTSRATLGVMAIAQQPLSTNQGFIAIEPNGPFSSEFIYCAVAAARDVIAAKAGGSTFLEVNKTNFKSVEVPRPSDDDLRVFDAIAGPSFSLIASLAQDAEKLAVIRDSLLPKLVSGRLRVRDIEDFAEETVAA